MSAMTDCDLEKVTLSPLGLQSLLQLAVCLGVRGLDELQAFQLAVCHFAYLNLFA